MTAERDLIVVGAGPAGCRAAIVAHGLGLSTLLVDEQDEAGGQVYRAPAFPVADDRSAGGGLRQALNQSGVPTAMGIRLWTAERGFTLGVVGAAGGATLSSRALILATGAQERVAPIPGWTLPGVIGLAAATALLKAQKVLPGEEVVVAGGGPLLLLVAALILAGGGRVAAIVDANPRGAWLRCGPALAMRPDLVGEGLGWLAQVLRHRVPIHSASTVRAVLGVGRPEGVRIARIGSAEERVVACDAVCLGGGLAPATEPSRLLGARHVHAPGLGGWTVATDADQRTDVPLLFACGDGAGILGAAAAPLRGEIAALAAARDLGTLTPGAFASRAAPLRRRLGRATRAGRVMTALTAPGPGLVRDATAATTICRCEGIDRRTIDAAIDAGAATPNAVKSATRCGMGPCGGRFCGDAVAALVAVRIGRALAEVGQMTVRPPLRPLPLEPIVAGFRYDDIPWAEPAPL